MDQYKWTIVHHSSPSNALLDYGEWKAELVLLFSQCSYNRPHFIEGPVLLSFSCVMELQLTPFFNVKIVAVLSPGVPYR